MKYFFPPQNKNYQFLQTNRSDDFGSIWSSFNLDFQSNLGVIRLAQKMVINTSSSDDADLGIPTAFEYFDDSWWAICGTRIFTTGGTSSITYAFTEDASSGFQTNYINGSDLAVFNSRIWASTSTTLYSKAAGATAWTSRDTLETGSCHDLEYFKFYNRLYYVDTTTKVSSIGTDDVAHNAATFNKFIDVTTSVGTITSIKSTSNYIWIGCLKQNGAGSLSVYDSQGTILQWDGFSATALNSFTLPNAGCLALAIHRDIPYAIDTEGRILKYNGTSFDEVARLPINRELLQNATLASPTNGRFVHFNGFIPTKNNTLLVAVNNLNSDTVNVTTENLPSGIWELDLDTFNFTHKYSFTLKTLASSTITDYGQNRILMIGAIKYNPFTVDGATPAGAGRGTILAGANVYTTATVSKSAIFLDSPVDASSDTEGQKRGYFVTTWFNTEEVQDKFERLWDIHKRFLTSSDKIVYKYRLIEEDPIQATITWTSTTTFTTTTDVSAYGPTATGFNGTTGGEVEVMQGTGGGSCTHITSVVNNAGTYTVTLDTAVTGVTGTAKARFQKWIKLYPDVTGLVKSWESLAIGGSNTQIQIKCCMEFTGDMEFHRFAIFSNEDITITQ